MAATHESKFRTRELQQEGTDAAKRAHGGLGKKCLALLLVVPLALALSACDVNIFTDTLSDLTDEDSSDDDGNITVTVETSDGDDEAEAESSEEGEQLFSGTFGGTEEVADVVFFDEGGISMTATGIEDDDGRISLNISITNESDATIIVSSDSDFAIGDTMTDTNWIYEKVAAGKTANEQLIFLDISSAEELTEVSGTFSIYDADSYTTLYEPAIDLVFS